MARPIEKTPIIKGEDAKRFRKNLLESLELSLSSSDIANRKKELREWDANYQKVVTATNGVFY